MTSLHLKELISIIVPVFNVEKYLRECIFSILNQTYKSFELILVDDGSTDLSPVFCDEFLAQDDRIILIHKKNNGVSATRNAGMALADGEYLGFVDSDDVCEPEQYERLFSAIIAKKADVSYCFFNDLDGNKKIRHDEPLRIGKYDKLEIYHELLLPMVGSPSTAPQCAPIMGTLCRSLYKKCLIREPEELHFHHVKMAEDLLFNVEYLCRCNSAVVIENALYNYRRSSESSSRRYITDLYPNITEMMELLKQALEQNGIFDQKMEEYYRMTLLYNLTWCISNESKKDNSLNTRQIVRKMSQIRNLPEYRDVLKWNIIHNIGLHESMYFTLIKLRLYHLIIMFNRRK